MAKSRKRERGGTVSESAVGTMPEEAPHREADTHAAPQMAGDTTVAAGDRHRVAMRAYELYLARGGADGAALDDWLTAERELSSTNLDRADDE